MGCLIRPADADADERPWSLISTRARPTGEAEFQAFRPRWHIESDAYRELMEGWRLEKQLWGKDPAVQLARVTMTSQAFNTAQVFLGRQGERLAAKGIRQLRRCYRHQ